MIKINKKIIYINQTSNKIMSLIISIKNNMFKKILKNIIIIYDS